MKTLLFGVGFAAPRPEAFLTGTISFPWKTKREQHKDGQKKQTTNKLQFEVLGVEGVWYVVEKFGGDEGKRCISTCLNYNLLNLNLFKIRLQFAKIRFV